jgi:hypothetical protein
MPRLLGVRSDLRHSIFEPNGSRPASSVTADFGVYTDSNGASGSE